MQEVLGLFSSEFRSRRYFSRYRRQHGCPRCGTQSVYELASEQLRCTQCRHDYSLFSGTALSGVRLQRREIAHLLYLFVLGVPSYRARQYTGVSLKTMQRLYTRFREALYRQSLQELRALNGEIELDEALFGGHRKGRRGWGAGGKRAVFGLYKRNGHVLVFPVPNRKHATLLPLIEAHTTPGSLYYTDDYHAYASLRVRGQHVVVSKSEGRPRGRDHINGIEGFWSYAKHWLYQYRGVPQHHFPLYLKEVEWRFNHREENLFHLLAEAITQPVATST